MVDTQKYLTITQIVEDDRYPFTRGQLRQFLLTRNENGLNHAVIKIGKRVYIDREKFEVWLESKIEVKTCRDTTFSEKIEERRENPVKNSGFL